MIVVGMNPSNRSTGNKVHKNSTFDRLDKWADALGVQHFSFINLFDYAKDTPTIKDVDFQSLQVTKQYDKVIALGGLASTALNKIDVPHFKLPHPSPRNRLLNDKAFEKRILKQCKDYLK
jgi:hypothetical protein